MTGQPVGNFRGEPYASLSLSVYLFCSHRHVSLFNACSEARARATTERRERFSSAISPRRTTAGSAGVTTSATWVAHPRLLFDSSHGGGPQGLADIASARTHACMHIALSVESPGLRRLPALNGTFYDFHRVSIEKVDRGNPLAISRSLAARSYSDLIAIPGR